MPRRSQNVVAYTVVVEVDNAREKLLPYLTANLGFEIGRRENVLLVPSAALRWRPQPQQIAPDVREKTSSGPPKRRWPRLGSRREIRAADRRPGRPERRQPAPRSAGGNVQEGMEVVVGDNGADDATNPFAPKIFKGGGERRR